MAAPRARPRCPRPPAHRPQPLGRLCRRRPRRDVVGEGTTEPPGARHAEVVALAAAGERARGATAYVSLEPCAHHGRTPPCTDALVAAGVSRRRRRPHRPRPRRRRPGSRRAARPRHRRRARARDGGTRRPPVPRPVPAPPPDRPGVLRRQDRHQPRRPDRGRRRHVPVDHRAQARADAHELRADSQAVVVGAGTALADRPTLTVRDAVAARGRAAAAPRAARRPGSRPGRRPAVRRRAGADARRHDRARAGGERRRVACRRREGRGDRGRPTGSGVDLVAVLELLGREGVLQALVEGGATLHGASARRRPRRSRRRVRRCRPCSVRPAARRSTSPGPPPSPTSRRLDARLGRPTRRRRPPRVRARERPARRGRGDLMFTGIVEELGRVRAVVPNEGGARIELECTTVLDDADVGASIAVNGCCLTVVEMGPGWWAADASGRDPRPDDPRRPRVRRPGEPRTPGAPRRPARRPRRPGSRRRGRHGPRARPARRRLHAGRRRRAGRPAPLRRREGLRHRRRREPHRDRTSTTAAFGVALIPHTLDVTTLGVRRSRRPCQPRGGRAREVRRATARRLGQGAGGRRPPVSGRKRVMPFTDIENAVAAIGRGELVVVVDDADRENEGDLIMAAEKVTPEAMEFMIRAHERCDLHADRGRAARRAAAPADGRRTTPRSQRTAFTVSVDAVHGTTTGISAADRADHGPHALDPHDAARRPRPPRSHLPAAYREGRRAEARRHTEATVDLARLAGLLAGRRPRRGRQRRRHDGAPARARALRRRARPAADLDRGPDPLPPRTARSSSGGWPRRGSPRSDGDFTAYVYESAPRRRRAHGVRAWRGRRQARVLVRVHSECLTGDVFGSMRCDCGVQLDLAARAHRGGGPRRRALPARPRGPRHRPRPQAARVHAAGRGPRHRRGQRRARLPGRLPRVRHRRADPRRSRRQHDAADDQQPGQVRRPRRLRARDRRAGAAARRADRENIAYLRTKQQKMGHLLDLEDEQLGGS